MILYKKIKSAYAETIDCGNFIPTTVNCTDWVEDSLISDTELINRLKEKYPSDAWIKFDVRYSFVPVEQTKTGRWVIEETYQIPIETRRLETIESPIRSMATSCKRMYKYFCSECKRTIVCDSLDMEKVLLDYPYCHCGAKMEEMSDKEKNEMRELVEIVRCKNCVHRPVNDEEDPHGVMPRNRGDYTCPCLNSDDYWYSWYPSDEWYCAEGEAKGEE